MLGIQPKVPDNISVEAWGTDAAGDRAESVAVVPLCRWPAILTRKQRSDGSAALISLHGRRKRGHSRVEALGAAPHSSLTKGSPQGVSGQLETWGRCLEIRAFGHWQSALSLSLSCFAHIWLTSVSTLSSVHTYLYGFFGNCDKHRDVQRQCWCRKVQRYGSWRTSRHPATAPLSAIPRR